MFISIIFVSLTKREILALKANEFGYAGGDEVNDAVPNSYGRALAGWSPFVPGRVAETVHGYVCFSGNLGIY